MRLQSDVTPAAMVLIRSAQSRLARNGIRPSPHLKAGVPALGTSDLGEITGNEDLARLVEERFLLTRLPGVHEQPFMTRIVIPIGASAGPVAEKKAIRAVRVLFDMEGILPKKFGSLTAQSNDAVFQGGAVTARGVQHVLVRDVTDATNAAVLSDDPASDAVPAGLAHGVTPIDAGSDLAAGVRELVAAMGTDADPASLAFVTDMQGAAKLGTAVDSAGALLFPGVGIHGGELLGLPLIVTKASPLDGSPAESRLFLIDGSGIAYGLDQVGWEATDAATIELSDDPTGDGDTPAAASQQMVSLFQEELTGFKCVLRAGWKKLRANAVAVMEGI